MHVLVEFWIRNRVFCRFFFWKVGSGFSLNIPTKRSICLFGLGFFFFWLKGRIRIRIVFTCFTSIKSEQDSDFYPASRIRIRHSSQFYGWEYFDTIPTNQINFEQSFRKVYNYNYSNDCEGIVYFDNWGLQ